MILKASFISKTELKRYIYRVAVPLSLYTYIETSHMLLPACPGELWPQSVHVNFQFWAHTPR